MDKPLVPRLVRHASLRQLQLFEALGRHRSFTKAAEELFLSQPTVSMQIKKLVDAAGVPLYEQIGKTIHLTDAGQSLHSACREVFGALARFDGDMSDLKGLKKGHLRLAVVTTAKYFAPIMLGQFCERYPGVDVSLKVTNRERLLDRMVEQADDFYIMGEPPSMPRAIFEHFTPNPLVVIAWPKHPLEKRKQIAVSELTSQKFIMREPGSGTRMAILRHMGGHDVTPEIRMELGSNEAIKQAVMGKLGISILSRHAVGADVRARRLRILDVQGFPIAWDWYVGYREQRRMSVLAQTFLDFVRADGRAIVKRVSA